MNTLSEQILEDVRVDLTIPEGFIVRAVVRCQKLPYNELGSTFAVVEFPPDIPSSVGN